ncbi:DUF2158 domain-containing protein [Pleomorphomonas koreensis]|uniref:DUF2158 domain-containing protein n=1 Tax=Pleomorphomonas koreensis TaxID=257440 RepID=UPI000419EB1E|nr:DUF2158 domain-containing protein [Pleomorphomonas koreensis]
MPETTANIETNELLSPAEEDFVLAMLRLGWTADLIMAGTRLPRIGIGLAAKAFHEGRRHAEPEAKPTTWAEALDAMGVRRKFKIGDVVQLASGGVRMTVVSETCGRLVECAIGEYDRHIEDLITVSVDERCLRAAKDLDDLPF